jgi:hypothetical protein
MRRPTLICGPTARDEAGADARHGQTLSPARVRLEEGDDGRAPPGSGCRRTKATRAGYWAEVGCGA